MKAFLPLAISCILFAHSGISQITITQADMPQPGDTIRLSTSVDSAGLPTPSLTGAGITWDYSALVPISQTIDTFLNVTSTPFAYQLYFNDGFLYPSYKSTVAQAGPALPPLGPITITKVINFYKDQSSNYESVGYGANIDAIPTSVKDDTIDVVYNFPMNYGNADSCHSSNHVNIPSLAYYGQFQYRINYVDGWGTLKTPYGSFQTLKVKTLLYASDSIYIDTLHFGLKTPQPEQIQYKWLANGQHAPLLQINETGGSRTPEYIYRDSARKDLGIAGINSPLNNVALYPNPATENTSLCYNLNTKSIVNIAIYSVDGRCVSQVFTGEQATGNHSLTISMLNLKAGIYLLEIVANGGQTVKKLVVAR